MSTARKTELVAGIVDAARIAVAVVEAGTFIGVQFFASEEAAKLFLLSLRFAAFPPREPTRGDGR